jgi:hypothetical protein
LQNEATFALTWEGLKVINSKGVSLHIGDSAKTGAGTDLLSVKNGNNDVVFAIDENGSLKWSEVSSFVIY